MTNFQRNNLDKAATPYLLQHRDNPIYWQEWSRETLDYAHQMDKPIFVSVGYATCHWCHVMANEAFSSQKVADFLNRHFVSIKVDREQRPDLDQYFMDFVTKIQGSGGWPLNVFLSSEGKPFFGGTYFPVKPDYGLPSFLSLLGQLIGWYDRHKNKIMEFSPHSQEEWSFEAEEKQVMQSFYDEFDYKYGGFGESLKFPPHCSLLFLMHSFEIVKNGRVRQLVMKTLDAMTRGGLHDHLQGGFYRYCVDRAWTAPHFEKMLYDQAMHMWVYSTAYQLFKRPEDQKVVQKTVKCLEETFRSGRDKCGLYYSAHDADTNHEEGLTCLWSDQELRKVLTSEEYKAFAAVYEISAKGNLRKKNHLIRRSQKPLDKIEEKLLMIRRRRKQPETDRKMITSWNALTGLGFLMASRYAGIKEGLSLAEKVLQQLREKHFKRGRLAHSSFEGHLQDQEFLEDYAAVLLLATYLFEETGKYKEIVEAFQSKLFFFLNGRWYANEKGGDFMRVPAQSYDQPTPSAVSMAEMAIFRAEKLLGIPRESGKAHFKLPLQQDFYNIMALFHRGHLHEIYAPEKLAWSDIPLNSIQIRANRFQDCHHFVCRQFKDRRKLLGAIK